MPTPIYNVFAHVHSDPTHGDAVYALSGAAHPGGADEQAHNQILEAYLTLDALEAPLRRITGPDATVTLSDGTTAMTWECFLHGYILTGRLLELVEPVLRKLNAPPDDPFFAFTLVRDGQVLDAKSQPIYAGGTAQTDRRFKHVHFIEQFLAKITQLATEGYDQKGRGAVALIGDPSPGQPTRRDCRYLTEAQCSGPGPFFAKVGHALQAYDPDNEMIVVFIDQGGDDFYRLKKVDPFKVKTPDPTKGFSFVI